MTTQTDHWIKAAAREINTGFLKTKREIEQIIERHFKGQGAGGKAGEMPPTGREKPASESDPPPCSTCGGDMEPEPTEDDALCCQNIECPTVTGADCKPDADPTGTVPCIECGKPIQPKPCASTALHGKIVGLVHPQPCPDCKPDADGAEPVGALRSVPCPECGNNMVWDDTPIEPCDECKKKDVDGAVDVVQVMHDAANDYACMREQLEQAERKLERKKHASLKLLERVEQAEGGRDVAVGLLKEGFDDDYFRHEINCSGRPRRTAEGQIQFRCDCGFADWLDRARRALEKSKGAGSVDAAPKGEVRASASPPPAPSSEGG